MNTDFLGSRTTNPYHFRNYDLTNFTMYVNGRQIPSESLSLKMGHEKTSVRGYATLFEGCRNVNSNSNTDVEKRVGLLIRSNSMILIKCKTFLPHWYVYWQSAEHFAPSSLLNFQFI